MVAGAAAGYGVTVIGGVALEPYYKNFISKMDEFHSANSNVMIIETNRMIKESGIEKKGFQGIKLNATVADFNKEMEKCKGNASFTKKTKMFGFKILNSFSKITNLLIGKIEDKNKILSGLKFGCYHPFTNQIYSSKTGSLLHEAGHAINLNKNFITRIPHRFIVISSLLLAPMAILTAMFGKKKNNQSGEKHNTIDRAKDFAKNHIGLTVAGLSLPILAEEGIASLRAVKFANKSNLLTLISNT